MYKVIEYPGIDDRGNVLVQALLDRGSLVKTAGVLHPGIAKYIKGIKPQPDKYLYVLVNALSAGEYWGSNINGDYFPEKELAHEGKDYGYKTFYDAGIYLHHQNKDPKHSIGKIVLAVYNWPMHRVELIHRIDRAKARKEGAEDVVRQLDSGQNPPTSMGCKVPYDICSWCGNKSKTKKDYCEHALHYLNHIANEDIAVRFGVEVGSKMYLWNYHPRFFDDSYVIIGADVTSFAIQKVARLEQHIIPSAFKAARYGLPKLADLQKRSAQAKAADILKRVPAMGIKTMSALQKSEPSIPGGLLEAARLPDLLSTLGSLGMVLAPHEFQHAMLSHMGHAPLANELDTAGAVFRHVGGCLSGIGYGPQHYSPLLKSMLVPMLPQRSMFAPVLKRRITIVIHGGGPGPSAKSREKIKHPLLDKISAAYNAYTNELPEKIASLSRLAISDPEVMEEVYPLSTVNPLAKTAGKADMALTAGLLPLLYLYGRSLEKRKAQGEPIGGLRAFIANHPLFSALMLGGALAAAGKVR